MTADRELPVGDLIRGSDARPPDRRRRRGRFVSLEPIDPSVHADPLWRAAHDGSTEAGRMWTYMPYGPFRDVAEMQTWLEGIAGSDDPLFLAILVQGRAVGMTSFLNADPPMRHIELGHIWYSPRAQRTEANTEAAYLMLREAFDELGYRRVEWKCDALNERSRAAAVRLGFTCEGVFRQHMVIRGRNRDTAWYSIIDAEWPAVRSALERWLAVDAARRPPLASLRGGQGIGGRATGLRRP